MNPSLTQNHLQYDTYYNKSAWRLKFRYDIQIKRKTCFHLLYKTGRNLHNQKVLDIGFGNGDILFSFSKNCELFGIEISKSAIVKAQFRSKKLGFKHAKFSESTTEKLNFPDNYFDILVASHIMEHVTDDTYYLTEIHRVLKPKGIAIILIPINEKYDDPNHIRKYTVSSFINKAQEKGFSILVQEQNETLSRILEDFYHKGYAKSWLHLGPIISALFNLPTSILPFSVTAWIDTLLVKLGCLPCQAGFILSK